MNKRIIVPYTVINKNAETNVPFIINKKNTADWSKEIWMEVRSLQGVVPNYTFHVSSIGRVKKCSLYDLNDVQIVSPTLDEVEHFMYFILELKDSIELVVKIHNIMAETFICKPSTMHNIVKHKNGKCYDNDIHNLEWVSGDGELDDKFGVLLIEKTSVTKFDTVEIAADTTGFSKHVIEDLCRNNEYRYGCYWKFFKKI